AACGSPASTAFRIRVTSDSRPSVPDVGGASTGNLELNRDLISRPGAYERNERDEVTVIAFPTVGAFLRCFRLFRARPDRPLPATPGFITRGSQHLREGYSLCHPRPGSIPRSGIISRLLLAPAGGSPAQHSPPGRGGCLYRA